MTAHWREVLARQATTTIARFVAANPEYAVDPQQPDYRGGTNFITFGHCGRQPIVFKYFVTGERWQNELYCLQHFATTGYVPRLLASVPDQMLVMTRLPDQHGSLPAQHRQQVSRQIGAALATLARIPLSPVEAGYSPGHDFKIILWGSDLRQVIARYLEICRRAQQAIPAYQVPFFAEVLTLVGQSTAVIDAQPRLLFHEDISNMAIHQGSFTGFYDLEMCRVGTAAMQLGVAVGICGPGSLGLDWQTIVTEYQLRTRQRFDQRDFEAILAMKLFYHLIRVCRWGAWDGDPRQQDHVQASAADAKLHLSHMRDACYQLHQWVDIDRWFPGLRQQDVQGSAQ